MSGDRGDSVRVGTGVWGMGTGVWDLSWVDRRG